MKKIIYLFPTNRKRLIHNVEQRIAPDDQLYGFNHLERFFAMEELEVSSKLEQLFNILLAPISFFFNSRYTKLNLGRLILALPWIWRADVVITCVDSMNKAAALAKKIGLFTQPVIAMAGNVMDGTERFPLLHRRILSSVNSIVTHAPVDQEKLSVLGLRNGICIPVGSDERFWQSVKWKVSDILQPVVSVGADRDRDYRILFLAAEQLPKLRFIVCCGQKNVDGLKIPKNVDIKINIPAMETRAILSKAEMVILPLKETYRANGQLSMLDAMLMGKPVLVSKTRGAAEPYSLKDEKNVLLIPAGDPGSLIKAIKKLQNSENLISKLSRVGRALALGYTTESYAEKIKKIIFTSS